jgi:hypothetical protein
MNAQSGQIPQYPADFPTSLHTPAPRSWLRRNWLWLLAVLFASGLLFVFGLLTLIFSAMRNSDVAKEATTMAQSNSAVVQRLGSPIEEGFFVSGSVNVGEGTGDADLSVPISGPKGKATVSVTAHKSAGVWNYSLMQVGIASTGERIDLLSGAPPTSENQSQPANPPQPAQSAAVDAPAPQPTTVAANSPGPSASADPQPSSPAASPSDVIQSQDANTSGIVAELTQVRRSEGVLSIKLRFRNTDSKALHLKIIEAYNYTAFYVTAGNKKYFILKDTDGTFLATEATSWDHKTLEMDINPGSSYTWWAKYPAPPPEVKKITFITPLAPPFEDVPLSDR